MQRTPVDLVIDTVIFSGLVSKRHAYRARPAVIPLWVPKVFEDAFWSEGNFSARLAASQIRACREVG